MDVSTKYAGSFATKGERAIGFRVDSSELMSVGVLETVGSDDR